MSVDYVKDGKIAIITLNRPQALNAIDAETLQGLSQSLLAFKDDDSLQVGIITGAGERAFSIGADIKTLLPQMKAAQGKTFPEAPTIMRGLELWKPIIAAINGAALGGGLELALSCDIRIASAKALFGLPEVNLGIIPGWGGTQRLARLIPRSKAAEMLLTGRPIDAQEAYRIGLVNKVVPPEQLMTAAREMAELILKVAPLAAKAAKQAMLQGLDLPLGDGLKLEKSLFNMLTTSRDFDEGCQASLEKRKPKFEGK